MDRMTRARASTLAAVLMGSCAMLAACGAGADGEAGESGGTTPSAATSATKAARNADPTRDMVSAVSPGKASAPVELKFSLSERPEVGRPIEVEIAVLPVSELDRISASFQPGAGLQLLSGQQMVAVEHPAAGVPLKHRVTIVPERDGIFFVSAVVLADSPDASLARTFSIPIIAGQGPAPAQGGWATPEPRDAKTP